MVQALNMVAFKLALLLAASDVAFALVPTRARRTTASMSSGYFSPQDAAINRAQNLMGALGGPGAIDVGSSSATVGSSAGQWTPPAQVRGTTRLFLDTASEAAWDEHLGFGIYHGVTTNPVLLEQAKVECTIERMKALAHSALNRYGLDEFMVQSWCVSGVWIFWS